MPMPPSPITSTVAPSSTLAVLITAPTPVCTAHPITQAMSRGVSAGIGMAPVSWMITNSENAAIPTPRYTTSLRRDRRVPPSGNVAEPMLLELTQMLCSPRTHQ